MPIFIRALWPHYSSSQACIDDHPKYGVIYVKYEMLVKKPYAGSSLHIYPPATMYSLTLEWFCFVECLWISNQWI